MRACIIFNPTARGDQARRFRELLQRLAGDCALRPTAAAGEAVPLATAAVQEGFDTIVAAGGDGTVSEVTQGIGLAPGGLEHTRLALIPLGTINVFARELGLPRDLRSAWAVFQAGRETRVDLPWVEFGQDQRPQKRFFVQLAGAGLDARAVAAVDWQWKKRIGPLAYIAAGLRALQGPQPLVQARCGDQRAAGELVLIGNGRFYGGSVPMFPEGDLRDGLLELRVLPRVGVSALARFGWAWLWDRSFAVPGERFLRAAEITLSCDVAMPFELDGDNVGLLPARFGVLREALRVVVP
jgi:YegS/Rv2252/BmrU family lipid kinase